MGVKAIHVPNNEQRAIDILVRQEMTDGRRSAARAQLLKTTLVSSSVKEGKVDRDLCLDSLRIHGRRRYQDTLEAEGAGERPQI